MVRHSKNNTNSAQFTYAERSIAKKAWGGTSTAELGSTAQRPWSSCVLCLSPAQRPTVDSDGHIFCRECVLSDLVAQKEELERIHKALQTLHDRRADREKVLTQQAHDRLVRDFEARQDLTRTSYTSTTSGGTAGTKRKALDDVDAATPDTATGAIGDASRSSAVATQASEQVKAQLEQEEQDAKKSQLPSFWLPSLTPSQQQDALEVGLWDENGVPTKPMCRAGKPHPLNVKQLTFLNFWKPSNFKAEEEPTPLGSACPTCQAAFNQTSHAYVLRTCGHVVCRTCVHTLVLEPAGYKGEVESLQSTKKGERGNKSERKQKVKGQCAHCDAHIKDLAKDLVKLQREGTGYAAAGNKTVAKKGIAFMG